MNQALGFGAGIALPTLGSVSVDSKGEVDVTSAQPLSLVEVEPWSGQVVPGAEEKYRPSRAGSEWSERLRPALSFLVVLTFLVLAIVFVLARGGVADPDIWWHLHNADYLIQYHALPRYDMYSFTVAGHPWINHEWLGELPYYFGWRALGLRGINAVTLSVLSLIFLGLLYLSYRHSGHYKASVAACCYAVFLAAVSFGPRTILFGYAYLVVLLIVLQRFRQKDSRLVWMIPPLFCLWVNTHGSWLIGLILFSIVIGTGLVHGAWGAVSAEPWTRSQRKKLLLVLVLVLVISALLRSCRWTLAELGLLTFALYGGLTYSRFLFLLGIVVAPPLAKILDFIPRYRREADTPVLNAFVIMLMIGAAAYFWPRDAKLQAAVGQQYPVQAMSYLEAHPPQGPMLNFYLWGGYINWRDPNLKIFLDSRVDIFEYSGVLQDYLDLLSLTQPAKVLEKYRISYVLFPPDEPLTYVLEHDQGWKVLYRDRISVLLERTKDHSANIAADRRNIIDGTGTSRVART